MSITAEPMLDEDEQNARYMPVGFRTLADEDIEDLCLNVDQLRMFEALFAVLQGVTFWRGWRGDLMAKP